jgi:hypothetical protein
VSILTLDIHRSKDMVQELQDSRGEEMYISLVFSPILGKISLTKVQLNKKLRWKFYLMTNLYGALTKDNGTISLIINNAKSLSKNIG